MILGGARSGKSSFAEKLATRRKRPVTMIATAQEIDDEMRLRIAVHRSSRPTDWKTIEEPLRIDEAVASVPRDDTVIVDCITVWLGNVLHHGGANEDVDKTISRLVEEVTIRTGSTLIVSNEVGLGIVPASELARGYRDLMGRVNTRLAAELDRAIFMVAGRYIDLKDSEGIE